MARPASPIMPHYSHPADGYFASHVPKPTVHTSDAHLKSLPLPPAFSSPASHSVSSSQTGLGIHIHIPTPQLLWMLIIGHPHPKFIDFHQLSVGTSLANLVPFQAPCWDPVLGKQLLVDWLNLMDRITCRECKSKQLHPTGNGLSVSLAEEDVLRYNPEYKSCHFFVVPLCNPYWRTFELAQNCSTSKSPRWIAHNNFLAKRAVKNLRSRRTMSDHGTHVERVNAELRTWPVRLPI